MKFAEALLEEHGELYAQFDDLEKRRPMATDLALVKGLGSMLVVALVTDARVEEELLFVACEKCLNSKAGLVAGMRLEHERIAQILQLMQERQELVEARNLVLHTIQTARTHFAKEDEIVLRMAQNTREAETLVPLGAQLAAPQRVLI